MRHMSAGNAPPGKQEEKEKEKEVAEEEEDQASEKSGSESGNSLLHGRLLAHRLYNKVTKW